jgi:hypothetical protein
MGTCVSVNIIKRNCLIFSFSFVDLGHTCKDVRLMLNKGIPFLKFG